MSNSRIMAIPLPLIVFAAVVIGLMAVLAVPRILANNAVVTDEVIHSCVNANSGEIKILADGDDGCKKNQTPLDWNAVGPPGPDGTNGTDGTNGASGYVSVRSSGASTTLQETEFVVYVDCPTGKVIVGGGYSVGGGGFARVHIIDSEPWPRPTDPPLTTNPTQWRVNAMRFPAGSGSLSWTLYASAICIDAP